MFVVSTCLKVLCVGLCTSSEWTWLARNCTGPSGKAIVCNTPCPKLCSTTMAGGAVGRIVSTARGSVTNDIAVDSGTK